MENWWKKLRALLQPKPLLLEIDPTPWTRAQEALYNRTITATEYIWLLQLPTRENRKPGQEIAASKSEIKRWCQANNVWINERPAKWDDKVIFPVISLYLFPKGNRISIF